MTAMIAAIREEGDTLQVSAAASDTGPRAGSTTLERVNARVVDALGKACPVPVIELAKAMAGVGVGEDVTVLADDPGSKVDIPVWCRMKRQQLVAVDETEQGWSFRVRRVQ